MHDDADAPLTQEVAATNLDRIAAELRSHPSMRLVRVERTPGGIMLSRGEAALEFVCPNIGDVTGGKAIVGAILRLPKSDPVQLPIITVWNVSEFLDRAENLLSAVEGENDPVKRQPSLQVAHRLSLAAAELKRRLDGISSHSSKVTGTTLTVLMVERGERHTFTYADRGAGKAVIEVRTTMLKAPMETRRLPDIRAWNPELFLEAVLGQRWKDGVIEDL